MAIPPAAKRQKTISEDRKKRTLADFLAEPGHRVITHFGSTQAYPTEEARSIIQGIVTAVLDVKADGSEHKYLSFPENYLLGQKRSHPYSACVRNLSTVDVLKIRNLLENAGEKYPDSTEVTLQNNREDYKCDDIKALEFIIFDLILSVDGRKPLLSAEWENFKDLFSKGDLHFASIGAHSCLWGPKKRLNFYRQLDDWSNPSKAEADIRNSVIRALRSMPILTTDWAKRLLRDQHLARFARKISRSRQCKPYTLIRCFRNIVEHCQETAPAMSPYRDVTYVDYLLRRLFPNMLEDIQERLLHAGFLY